MHEQRQPIGRGLLLAAIVASVTWGASAWAQSGDQASPAPTQPSKPVAPPPGSTVPVDSIEPGVNTSAIQPSSPEAVPPAEAAPTRAIKPNTPAPKSSAPASKSGESASKTSEAASKPAVAAAGKAHDSIQLDTTQITGNRELPKVLYIVPWKRSDLGDLVGKPVNSLLDEVLTPVDRDVFKRQNRYYDALKPDAPKESPGAATGPAEKR